MAAKPIVLEAPAVRRVILPENGRQPLRIDHEYKSGSEFWYWLQSDVHYDSPESLHDLYFQHLREAKRLNAGILDFGDMSDVISNVGDKRGTKATARPKDAARVDYLDGIVNDTADDFKEYADLFILKGYGNHDEKMTRVYGTDISRRIAERLSCYRTDPTPIYHGGYAGWVRFTFGRTTPGAVERHAFLMKWHHGYGGGGAVTKGVIQENRTAAGSEGFDIFVSGHVHEKYQIENVVEYFNVGAGELRIRKREHVRLGSYKMDFRLDGEPTWHIRKGGGPKPLGGMFLRFYCPDTHTVEWELRKPRVNYNDLR